MTNHTNNELKTVLGNTHASTNYSKKHVKVLLFTAFLLLALLGVEIAGSVISKSLALLSDAVHVFSDFLGVLSALIAIVIAKKHNTPTHTYGYSKIEAVVTFANCILLFFSIGFIIYESIKRTLHPEIVLVKPLIIVGTFGLFANIAIAYYVFKNGAVDNHHHHHNSNNDSNQRGMLMQNVFLHFVYDIAGSFIAISSGVIIYFTSWFFVDIMLSVIIAILLTKSTYTLIKQSIKVLLDGTPSNINIIEVKQTIEQLSNCIINAHHLHIWMINETDIAATLHINATNNANNNNLLKQIKLMLHNNYNINHSVIQIENQLDVCIDDSTHHTTQHNKIYT